MNHRATELADALLEWSQDSLRDLPWRQTRDPWAVLVSEIMLQQTQVSRVAPRYRDFLARFPTPAQCAAGTPADVIALWSGLGYNRRAVNLWRAAEAIADQHDGKVPDTLDELLALPGIGPYTARAVLAFAFEHDVAILDTNVGRLLARWFGERLQPKPAQALADSLVPADHGWLWNQTLLDFAVAICDKRNPHCSDCPIFDHCSWQGSGPDPAHGSAGVSTPQSKFEGSRRQVRGRIVDLLRDGPKALDDLLAATQQHPNQNPGHDVEKIIDKLIADGLAERQGETICLPSSTSASTA